MSTNDSNAQGIELSVTNKPNEKDDERICAGLQSYNKQFSSGSFELLSVYCRLPNKTSRDNDSLIGGLTGVTFGNWLHISDFWVLEAYRRQAWGSKILLAAEAEAIDRQCIGSTLNTYSFQALEFYLKMGYTQFGSLSGYAGKFERHYLQKNLFTATEHSLLD